MKDRTKKTGIASLPDAPVLHVPLTRYFGSHPEPLVAIGDRVLKNQLIGDDTKGLSMKTHAPVSGEVTAINEAILADRSKATIVVIRNDFADESASLPAFDCATAGSSAILERIGEAGIVGEGGAQFPTEPKYLAGGGNIHTLIANGAECEPYLTADYALMAQRTRELLDGILIASRALGAGNIIIGIEKQNAELQDIFRPLLLSEPYLHIRLAILSGEYPQGSELQLIRATTGVELPRSTRPVDAGIAVSNVATLESVFQAVANNRPLTRRIVTVSGEGADRIGNFDICIGTPVSHIISALGLSAENCQLVLGGPMMGHPVSDTGTPLTKGSGALLLLPEAAIRRENCIGCGYCVEACPMNLMPMKFEELLRRGRAEKLRDYSLDSCIECAACEYVCPSRVPLVASIRAGKSALREAASAARP